MALTTAIPTPGGAYIPVTSNQQLATMLRSIDISGALATGPDIASGTTYTWTTAKAVDVTQAGATCNITLPNETDLVSWPVGEARTLRKMNTSANVIGITALTNVGYNLAAVNTAITTLVGSATAPGIATGVPVWTISRASATSYLIWVGI